MEAVEIVEIVAEEEVLAVNQEATTILHQREAAENVATEEKDALMIDWMNYICEFVE